MFSSILKCLLPRLPRLPRRSQGRRKRSEWSIWSAAQAAEQFEERVLLTPFYDLTVLASTASPEFDSFGDLVSINNVVHGDNPNDNGPGTVAFVGYNEVNFDGQPESGLWTAGVTSLINVNPSYSDTSGRDFGRAVDLNDQGILSARDRYSGDAAQFFVRTWDSKVADEHTDVASANNVLQPDFGTFSLLQTFTDINDHGDVAYIGQSLDATYRTLMYQPVGGPAQPVSAFPIDQPVPRPQLTDDGRMLYRSTESYLALRDPQTGVNVDVVKGFRNIGYGPGISKDGQLIAFIGDKGDGLGVYLAYQTGATYDTVRVAGAGEDGWTDFDLADAVRVNNTLMTERGVTVAFEAVHGTLGRGIYTARVSFIDINGPLDWELSFAEPYVSGAIPVVRVGESLGGQAVTDVEFWNGLNDRNRGELAFWVRTSNGEKIVRAEPWQVVALDFSPVGKPLDVLTPSNSSLLSHFGITGNVGWDANFAAAMQTAGLTSLTTTTVQYAIVDTVQSYFQDIHARVRVIGRPGEALPAYVPWTSHSTIPVQDIVRGVYQSIFIGAKKATEPKDLGDYGKAASTMTGMGGLDYFNQVTDDFGVVFADRIFASPGAFTNPATAPYAKLVQAVSSITAHEIAHNFGLFHLEDNLSSVNNEIMRAKTFRDLHLTINSQFSSQSFPRESYEVNGDPSTLGSENSAARLVFATGSAGSFQLTSMGPDVIAMNVTADSIRSNLPYVPSGEGPSVARLLLGITQPAFPDSLPSFVDLGQGNISELLTAARVSILPGTGLILLGSTDGTRLDIVGVPNGTSFDLSELERTYLGIATDGRLQATFDPESSNNGIQLFHIPTAGVPVLMGAVSVQTVPELSVAVSGATLESGTSIGFGETTPGGGPLVKTLTLENTGSGPLAFGTVTISGPGYSVTQPAATNLAPGASTTIQVTLSDSTAGVGLTGTLTIPSNNPGGAFVLTIRGTVDDRPRVQGVTRIDDGTGPVRIQIDFSGRLQPGPAGDPNNFAIVAESGSSVIPVSAVYSEAGGHGRVILTTAVNVADLPAGKYAARFDGSKVVAFNGAPLATSIDQLLVANLVDATISTFGDGPNGVGLISGPVRTGFGPPSQLAVADLNGDGIPDIIAISAETSELVLLEGEVEGGYGSPIAIPLSNPGAVGNVAHPGMVRVTDWDANGTLDLAVLDNGVTPYIYVLLNDGHANFSTAVDTPIPLPLKMDTYGNEYYYDGAGFVVGDFTGDGLQDFALEKASSSYSNPNDQSPFMIIAKDQFLGYTVQTTLTNGRNGENVASIVTADFNEDGRVDLMTNNTGYFQLRPGASLYLSNSSGALGAAQDIRFGVVENEDGGIVDLGGGGIACDFNGDGHLDLVGVVDLYSNDLEVHIGSSIMVLEGDGHGNFTHLPYQALNRRGVTLLGAADLNGDGRQDLLLRAPFVLPGNDPTQYDSVWSLIGNGQGGFTPGALIPTAPSGDADPGNFVLTDFTGDGLPDVLFGNTQAGRIGLAANDGTGAMQAMLPVGPLVPLATWYRNYFSRSESGLLVTDVNRDGYADQVRLISEKGSSGADAVDILLGNAAGDMQVVDSYSTQDLDGCAWIRSADLNNDGWPDLLLGKSSGSVEVLVGVQGTHFSPLPLADAGTFGAVVTGSLVDVNHDGNLDLVAQLNKEYVATQMGVFFGNGTGKLTFNLNTLLTAGDNSYFAGPPVVIDVTGDGKPDLLTGSVKYVVSEYVSQLNVFTGVGNGKFIPGPVLTRDQADAGSRLISGDFNGDGIIDILSVDSDAQLYFYLGTGAGQFAAAPDRTISLDGTQFDDMNIANLVLGDFNNDNFQDIALTTVDHYGSPIATLLLRGDATGHFGAAQELSSTQYDPYSLARLPIAGTINVGQFTITHPPINILPGAIDLTASTLQAEAVVINPRAMLASLTHIPLVVAVAIQPTHGTVTMNVNGTPEDLTDDVMVYTPAQGYFGADVFTYLVADGNGGTATGTVTIAVAQAGSLDPVLTTTAGAVAYLENASPVLIDPTLSLTDSDSADFQGGNLTISIATGRTMADQLVILQQAIGQDSISLSATTVLYNGATIGTWAGGSNGLTPLVISFTSVFATPSAVQALAQSIGYSNSSNNPSVGDRLVQFVVSDGDSGVSLPATRMVTVSAINSAPILTTSTAVTSYTVGALPVVVAPEVVVSDVDSPDFNGGSLTMTLYSSMTGDRLAIRDQGPGPGNISLNGANVLFGADVVGTWTGGTNGATPLVITFTSSTITPAIAQALARQIVFSSSASNPAIQYRTVGFLLTDGDNGTSEPAYKDMTVTANVFPQLTTSAGTTSYTENAPPVIVDSGILISDPDSISFSGGYLAMTLTAGGEASDQLAIRNQGSGSGNISLNGTEVRFSGNIIGNWYGGNGVGSPLVIYFNSTFATPAAVQALARNVVFSTNSDNPGTSPRSIEFIVADEGQNTSVPTSRSLSIDVANDPPSVTASSGVNTYSVAMSSLVIDSALLVADADSPDLNGGVLTVGFKSGQTGADRLAIRNVGTGAGQIGVSGSAVSYGSIPIGTFSGGMSDNSDLVITFNSNATPSIVQELARNVTFEIAAPSSTLADRVIRFLLSDGDGGTSVVSTKTVAVDIPSANHAPAIGLPSATVTYSKFAVPVAVDRLATVTDPDSDFGKLGGGTLVISINVVKTGKIQRDKFDLTSLNGVGAVQSSQLISGRQVTTFRLNGSATALEVQAALREVKFSTSKAGLRFTTRSVKLELVDSEGASSGVISKSINVSRKRIK